MVQLTDQKVEDSNYKRKKKARMMKKKMSFMFSIQVGILKTNNRNQASRTRAIIISR